jgi:hypothetical protein
MKVGPNTLAVQGTNPQKGKFDGNVSLALADGTAAVADTSVAASTTAAVSIPTTSNRRARRN